jgi:hypothetical protein
MSTGSKQIIKTQKSKFKKNQDKETFKQFRKKHHDKSTYRLMKDEGKDYDH